MTQTQESIIVSEKKKHKLEFIIQDGLLNWAKVSLDGRVVFDMKPNLWRDRGIEIISIDGQEYELYWLTNIRNHLESLVFMSPEDEILWMYNNDRAVKADMSNLAPSWDRKLILAVVALPCFIVFILVIVAYLS